VVAGPYSLADLGEDVRALLDRLGVRRAHFVGLSLGGMVGMWLGQNAPERLGSLTLCCTSAELGPRSGWVERARAVRAEGTAAVAEAVVQRWFTPGWRATHPGRVRFYESMVAATPAEGYAACCEAIGAMDIVNDLPRISAPVLVISGEQDPATPTVHGARIARAVAQGRLQEVGPAAHLASAEQPATVGALIAQHVRDHAGVMTAADQGVPSQAR
jgi:3-oxoadipate enol-lactonase